MRTFNVVLKFGTLFAAVALGSCGGAVDPANTESDAIHSRPDNLLYVWASDATHQLPDFVAVVNFDQSSHHYGDVRRVVPLPAPFATGNEPHHIGLSSNGRWLGVGGLLSVLRGQPEVFFFDVGTTPSSPQFVRSDDPPLSAITDEFVSLSNGGFLVTMMGAADGSEPGRVAEYNSQMQRVNEWPIGTLPSDGSFNPHGISVREEENLMVTSDFICPAHTLHIPGGDQAVFRDTIRVWDLAGRAIIRTIHAGDPNSPPGMMEIRLIPGDSQLRAYAPGTADGQLYLIDTQNGTATSVYDFNANFSVPGTPGTFPALMQIDRNADRMFVALEYFGTWGKIVMMDISHPSHPTVIQSIDLGAGAGPHYLRLTADERRLIATDYFLVEDLAPGGVVQADGDHKVHVFNVGSNGFWRDPSWNLDMDTGVPGYTNGVRPHGVVSKRGS